MTTLARKIESDGNILTAAKEFFQCASGCVIDDQDISEFESQHMEHGKPYWISFYGDCAIALGENEIHARDSLVKTCATRLGHEYGNPDDIKELVHNALANLVVDRSGETDALSLANRFRSSLLDLIQQQFQIVAPNHLFRFIGDPQPINIGTISMLPSKQLNRFTGHDVFVVSESFSQRWNGNGPSVEMPALSWIVPVKASAGNATTEARWFVDAAVSLVRLACWPYFRTSPSIGEVEPAPFASMRSEYDPLLIGDSGVSIRTPSSSFYLIDDQFVTRTGDCHFMPLAGQLVDPEMDSCGYFFRQGLGWLSRGRQAHDHSQRVLLFFTALETLLTRDTNSGQLTESLARNVATILARDVEKRPAIAQAIKVLYSYRSKTVHKGERDVTHWQCNEAQYYAESVFGTLLFALPFDMPIKAFWNALDEASYGTQWSGVLLSKHREIS